jgi:hypothetical protein
MIHAVFEWREDKEFGGTGWILKGFPDFNISKGFTISHDVLEHFEDGDGSLAHEMMAFGAMIFIRGETGWFENRPYGKPTPEALAGDIANFLEEVNADENEIEEPPSTVPSEEHIEELIQEIMISGVKQYADDSDSEIPALVTEAANRMIGWLRIGYARAAVRYKDHEGYEVMCCFNRITEMSKRFEHEDFGELHVYVDLASEDLDVKMLVEYGDDYDYGDDLE